LDQPTHKAATPKFEVKRHGAVNPSNDCRAVSLGSYSASNIAGSAISSGNPDENQKLRGRGTVLEALIISWKDMRMLSVRTGDKLRAISAVNRQKKF